jgi:sulfoquinovosyltransferase
MDNSSHTDEDSHNYSSNRRNYRSNDTEGTTNSNTTSSKIQEDTINDNSSIQSLESVLLVVQEQKQQLQHKNQKSWKICLMVEPSPFTYVCGYANRFKEMLYYLNQFGDKVQILTVQTSTTLATTTNLINTTDEGYPIIITKSFPIPVYSNCRLSCDLPEMKGRQIIKQFQPDIIHATSPGILLWAAVIYSRFMNIPLIMSHQKHLPMLGMYFII